MDNRLTTFAHPSYFSQNVYEPMTKSATSILEMALNFIYVVWKNRFFEK